MTKKDIVIIDSGVFYEHPLLSEIDIEGVTVRLVDGGYRICPDAYDEIGHGTAVCGTIFSNMLNKTDFHVLMIKIYEESTCVELGALLFALSYIEREIDCDIIHISSGVLEYSQELHELCRHLTQKEICIVAAFDNNGCVSYPAAYDEVIGVDASQECRKWNEWIYVENGIVNILAKGGNHRLAWISPNYILTQGASFSAGYITGLIAKKLKDGLPKDAIKKFLRENAVKIYNRSSLPQNNPVFNFTPHRVALFPYNKEMHSLINYYDMLSFEIHGIYSSKYLGHVGRDVFSLNGRHHFTIQNIDDLDWNAIDTLILGHVFEISQAAQMDYKATLLNKCLENRVNVYAFDGLDIDSYRNKFLEKGLGIFYPQIRTEDLIKKDGKLYAIGSPVLGVFGTSSVQGKFTLQLHLRQLLLEKGYIVEQMGTEPTSLLFGMDTIYPFGYASAVAIKQEDAVEVINNLMHEMDCRNPDIILVGSQSGTVPSYFFNTGYLNIPQQLYLIGTNPDAVVLCVNIQDDISYIQRTIAVIENLVICKVIAIAVFPLAFPNDLSMIRQRKLRATSEEIEAFIQILRTELLRPVFLLGKQKEMDALLETCLTFFTGDENDECNK